MADFKAMIYIVFQFEFGANSQYLSKLQLYVL